ncbi:hypothetical protein E2C01_003307 [Portunus trituberculatus]|uniref:Uncharacterized protein n=1 Tax=Portunus trituberculatus TaxID=210409 RepID=A0A5B7CM23_PORTR|nr:hypothetical protein [Portunus trituberculatus]
MRHGTPNWKATRVYKHCKLGGADEAGAARRQERGGHISGEENNLSAETKQLHASQGLGWDWDKAAGHTSLAAHRGRRRPHFAHNMGGKCCPGLETRNTRV